MSKNDQNDLDAAKAGLAFVNTGPVPVVGLMSDPSAIALVSLAAAEDDVKKLDSELSGVEEEDKRKA
jgi:hypothetical protein